MPGIVPAAFVNRLRALGFSPLDRDNETPRTPQPGGGHLLDVTWAFNQATGARPEQWEVDDILGDGLRPPPRMEGAASYPVDPLTDEIVFPINTNLPSLNRLPGIIFVPAGWFPILGTIRLFGGQQIIGVAATSEGSVLVKYGDGACIRVQSPTNYADDRHLTVERALRYHHDVVGVGELTELLARFEADYSAALAAAPEVPPPWLADDSKRRGTLRKTLAAGRPIRSRAAGREASAAALHLRGPARWSLRDEATVGRRPDGPAW